MTYFYSFINRKQNIHGYELANSSAMANMHEIINDLCFIISVIALLGILLLIILEDFNYFSGDTPAWKLQLIGSAIGAIITASATISTIFIKDWWENKIKVRVELYPHVEDDADGGYEVYMAITARNYSKIRDVVLDIPWLELHYDGKWRRIEALRQVNIEGLDHYVDEMGHIIEFPYDLKPGMRLFIAMENPNRLWEHLFWDGETDTVNYPKTELYLIAHFNDQLENSFVSSPYYEIKPIE